MDFPYSLEPGYVPARKAYLASRCNDLPGYGEKVGVAWVGCIHDFWLQPVGRVKGLADGKRTACVAWGTCDIVVRGQ